ncbi:hypothetical protein ACT4S5_18525 [Kocuria oceani]|uniref:hypothetical protein n=1 Tax=Kocuria oceani TaxID=988827 RepID=UPI004035DD4B
MTVSVDLTAAEHVEVIAVDLLRWAVSQDETVPGVSPVRILTPTRCFTAAPAAGPG